MKGSIKFRLHIFVPNHEEDHQIMGILRKTPEIKIRQMEVVQKR